MVNKCTSSRVQYISTPFTLRSSHLWALPWKHPSGNCLWVLSCQFSLFAIYQLPLLPVFTPLFGANGLAESRDDVTFEVRLRAARETIQLQAPDFLPYFNSRIEPIIREKFEVAANHKADQVLYSWMNNGCESANHIAKMVVVIKVADTAGRHSIQGILVPTQRCWEGLHESRVVYLDSRVCPLLCRASIRVTDHGWGLWESQQSQSWFLGNLSWIVINDGSELWGRSLDPH